MRNWDETRAELLSNPETRQEYELLRPKYELISQIIAERDAQGITQQELANKTGIKRSNISRLESGNCNPTVDFLSRVAFGLGLRLSIILTQGGRRI
jgi:ribosome-binding protein aMBF1 (putative translation factor)